MKAYIFILVLCSLYAASPKASSNKADKARTEASGVFGATELLQKDIGTGNLEKSWPDILVTSASDTTGWRGPYLKRMPIDPWGNKYALLITENELKGIYSYGKNGVDDLGEYDDVSSWKGYEEIIYFPHRRKNRYVIIVIAGLFIISFVYAAIRIISKSRY